MSRGRDDLGALIGSRICHDLISPIGAIGNGVELLTLAGSGHAAEIALISESVGNASARIRFFRIAFGKAEPEMTIAASEVSAVIADLFGGGRLQVGWAAPASLPRAEVKLAFLLLLCLETAMPWGGEIAVRVEAGRWSLSAAADRLRHDGVPWDRLSNPDAEPAIGSAEVQFALLGPAARQAGRAVMTDIGERSIRISF